MEKQQITITVPQVNLHNVWRFTQKWLLPNPGTLMLILILALTVPAIARTTIHSPTATSLSTIPYQGRLADASGNPITDRQNMEFRLYDTPVGGTPLWEEFWTGGNSVNVSDGLFSVMLGSIETSLASAVQGNDQLYLGSTVGTDTEMSPRVQLGSVPIAMISLTVSDGSVTTGKIADGAITTAKINGNAVGNNEIASGAVTAEKLDEELIIYQMTQTAPVTILGSKPNYWFADRRVNFTTPFPHKTLTVIAWLTVSGVGLPIAQPWQWDNAGFSINSHFYCDCDITSATIGYTAIGY